MARTRAGRIPENKIPLGALCRAREVLRKAGSNEQILTSGIAQAIADAWAHGHAIGRSYQRAYTRRRVSEDMVQLTPMDRVRRAFRRLRRVGYFAGEGLGVSISDGLSLIPPNREDRYVFFHLQDQDDFVARGEMWLAWSGDVARICGVLEDCGLIVGRPKDDDERIFVSAEEEARA